MKITTRKVIQSFQIPVFFILACIHSFGQTNTTAIGKHQEGSYRSYKGDYNVHLGAYSGWSGNSGTDRNVFIGYNSGRLNTAGDNNVFIGYYSGYYNTSAIGNTFIGTQSGYQNTSGSNNAFIGGASGYNNTTGTRNTYLGVNSGNLNTTGSNNTNLGYRAGYSNRTGSGNVFLGYQAGYNETGSNKLYIDNSSTSSPLVKGDFSTNQLGVNTSSFQSGYALTVGGAIRSTSGNLSLGSGATIDDDTSIGGNSDDWIRLNGYVEIKSNTDSYGIVLRDKDNTNYLGLTQKDGWSYFSDTQTSSGYFLRGNSDDVEVRDQLSANRIATTNYNTKGGIMNLSAGGYGMNFYIDTDNNSSDVYRWYGNGEEILRLTDDGKLGVGIAPTGQLHLADLYAPGGKNLIIGDDVFFTDIDQPNTVGLHGLQNSDRAGLQLGSAGAFVYGNSDGNLGVGITSPEEKLHVNGSMRGHVSGGAIRIQSAHGYVDVGSQNTSWSHFSTDRPRFYFNKAITVDEGLIGSYDEDLQLQTSGTTAITVSNTNQDVTIANNLIIEGTLKLDRTGNNIPPDDNVEDLMVLKSDGTLAIRDVRSIESPWLLDSLGAGLINIGCDPNVVGDCEINVFDLNGNLRIGDNSVLDDDMEYGGLGDDWMKFSGYVELSTSSDAGDKGLILLDRSDNLKYLNLFQNGDISYFSNSQDANESGYFLKSVGRNVEFGGEVTIPTLLANTISTPNLTGESLEVSNQVKFNLSSNSSNEEVLVTGIDGVVNKRAIDSFSPWNLNPDNSYSTPSRLGIGELNPDENTTLSVSSALNIGFNVKNTNLSSSAYGVRSEVSGENVKAIAAVDATTGEDVFRVFGNGIVEAKEVLVSLDVWNDHVFYPTYDLMPLEKVEEYVKENHHLPEIPSQEEVFENGVNLGEMDALLLKKVEELTLYIIDQNKQLKEQADLLKKQAKMIEKLEQKLGN